MGLLDKLQSKVTNKSAAQTQQVFQAAPPAPTLGPDSVFRYRKQRGINLGTWFVLERWIHSHPFRNAVPPGQSDFDVARGSDAQTVLEDHWDTWIQDADWQWIKDHGYNSVRLPIGYYHLVAAVPDVVKGTDFEHVANVFSGAWQRIENAIKAAEQHNLGILIDLHAAAGAQNADAHSGLSTGTIQLFSKSANLRSTSLALRFLSSYLAPLKHVVGLELLNEPANNNSLGGWYESTLKEVRAIAGPHFPIYVHDAWDTAYYARFVGGRDDFVVCDHHLYRCYTDQDKNVSGAGHANLLRGEFGRTFAGQSSDAKGNFVVGEWSAALDDWNKGMPDSERDSNKREFAKAQLDLYEQSAAGWWFWTYKKGDGWDAGWSAKDATRAEILPAWVGSKQFKGQPSDQAKQSDLVQGHEAHKNYWSANGGSPNPEVYAPGFSQGWDDALLFLGSDKGTSELGFISPWVARRKEEYEAGGNKLGAAAWEWEHGFKQGVEAATRAALN